MKTIAKITAVALAAIFGFVIVAGAEDAKLPPASTKAGLTFDTDVRPIFMASCMPCHDGTRPKQAAKLALDTLAGTLKGDRDGKVLTAGESAKSSLVLSVAHIGDDPDAFMPKGKNAKPLTPEQIGIIRAWIDQGAK